MNLKANLAAAIVLAALPAAQVAASPNILLVIADDMGLDASPCHAVGDNKVTMPNLVSLCEQGMVFDNAYSAPVCSPTRASILTGKHGFRTGVGAAIPRSGGNGIVLKRSVYFRSLERDQLQLSCYWKMARGRI